MARILYNGKYATLGGKYAVGAAAPAPAFTWDLTFEGYADGVYEDTTGDYPWERMFDYYGYMEVQPSYSEGKGDYTKAFAMGGGNNYAKGNYWYSEMIDIAGLTVDVSIVFSGYGGLEPADWVESAYSLDGGPDLQMGYTTDPEISQFTHSIQGINGASTLKLKVYYLVSFTSEWVELYQVTVNEQ